MRIKCQKEKMNFEKKQKKKILRVGICKIRIEKGKRLKNK